jgi:hypothetical protein
MGRGLSGIQEYTAAPLHRRRDAQRYGVPSYLSPMVVARRLLDRPEGSVKGAEVAGAKRLHARLVATTIERRDGIRAASSRGFFWGAEP